jgi:imidazole glycerol phosphate synthase subunit HisF
MLSALATGAMATGVVETIRQVPLAATCGAGVAVLDEPRALLAATWDDVSIGAAAPEAELPANGNGGGASALAAEVPAGAALGPMGKVVVSSSLKKVRVPGSTGDVDMSAKGKDDSSNITCRDTMILLE